MYVMGQRGSVVSSTTIVKPLLGASWSRRKARRSGVGEKASLAMRLEVRRAGLSGFWRGSDRVMAVVGWMLARTGWSLRCEGGAEPEWTGCASVPEMM